MRCIAPMKHLVKSLFDLDLRIKKTQNFDLRYCYTLHDTPQYIKQKIINFFIGNVAQW